MTTDAMKSDHERIYLQPLSAVEPSEGRQWCQDNVWPTNCENDAAGVEYIRAGLAMLAADHGPDVEAMREALVNIQSNITLWPDGSARQNEARYVVQTFLSAALGDGRHD